MGVFGDSFGVLNCFFSGLGFTGLVFTIRSQQKQMQLQRDEHERREIENNALLEIQLSQFEFQRNESKSQEVESRSLFNLENSTLAYDEAQSLLSDGNNDRVTWIRAARMLKIAKMLADDITIENHKNILEVRQLKYRQSFHNLLVNAKPEFFYGVSPNGDMDSTAWASISGGDSEGVSYTNHNRRIPEEAIKAVWEAALWPKDYSDPLTEKFSQQEKDDLFIVYRQLNEYFKFDARFEKIRKAENHYE